MGLRSGSLKRRVLGGRRRASWLEQDLRTRRRHPFRTNSRDLGTVADLYVLAGVVLLHATSSRPLLQAIILGALLGAAAVAAMGFLADGSLLAGLGRSIENDVGDELRHTRGVYSVISAVPFDRFDVDHVVLTLSGYFAVEVKEIFGRQLPLRETYGLHQKIRQTRCSAKTVAALIRSHGRQAGMSTAAGPAGVVGFKEQHVLDLVTSDRFVDKSPRADLGDPAGRKAPTSARSPRFIACCGATGSLVSGATRPRTRRR